jgi:hypothetical protein
MTHGAYETHRTSGTIIAQNNHRKMYRKIL